MEELVKATVAADECALEVYKDLAQPIVRVVGKSLGTTLEFLFTPIAWLQLVNDKTKVSIQHRLQQYADKMQQVPQEKQCEVHPELGVPIVQRLSYTTNDDVAELFLELLANASNIDKVGLAHPSFISIIDRLSPDEARILVYFKNIPNGRMPYVNIKSRKKEKPISEMDVSFEKFDFGDIDTSFITIQQWVTPILQNVALDFPANIHLYLANLISCGLIKDEYGFGMTDIDDQYAEIEKSCNIENIKLEYASNEYSEVEAERSFFSVTGLGKQFLQACVRG